MATITQQLQNLHAYAMNLVRIAEKLDERLTELEASLPKSEAPFEPGQAVRPRGGNRRGCAEVLQCEKAFGDWVVMVSFRDGGKPYTYPASELEPYA